GEGLNWEKWIPPTAKVKTELDANLSSEGPGWLYASEDAVLSAGAIRVTYEGLNAVARGRINPAFPYEEDFEQGYELNQVASDGISFAYPPLPWLGARMRWQVQELDGERVAGNTLDRVLFQRAINFIGSWKSQNYIVEMDVKVDAAPAQVDIEDLEPESGIMKLPADDVYLSGWNMSVTVDFSTRPDIEEIEVALSSGGELVHILSDPAEPPLAQIELPHQCEDLVDWSLNNGILDITLKLSPQGSALESEFDEIEEDVEDDYSPTPSDVSVDFSKDDDDDEDDGGIPIL
ncbi:MAG: hypothetical protein EB157_05600, partial [Euryarchaeota archaeon]|nr:hypothetical protein [Euryarchaeota archaeon]